MKFCKLTFHTGDFSHYTHSIPPSTPSYRECVSSCCVRERTVLTNQHSSCDFEHCCQEAGLPHSKHFRSHRSSKRIGNIVGSDAESQDECHCEANDDEPQNLWREGFRQERALRCKYYLLHCAIINKVLPGRTAPYKVFSLTPLPSTARGPHVLHTSTPILFLKLISQLYLLALSLPLLSTCFQVPTNTQQFTNFLFSLLQK